MQELRWKTSCGCAKCRPALNYYLLAAWPGVYADDQPVALHQRAGARQHPAGRHLFGRAAHVGRHDHAEELRAIADVVEKFNIPAVKCTGGQRIDLLGVKKEDLPAVWADLNDAGLVSGHAYGKALRTVKTCVGTDWCRFGTRIRPGSGSRSRNSCWGSWTPAQGEDGGLGLPAQLRRGDHARIGRDLRRQRLRVHFAGAARARHQGHRSALHSSRPRTMRWEVIVALVQLYREQGALSGAHLQMGQACRHSGDLKAQVVEDLKRRRALFERFLYAAEILPRTTLGPNARAAGTRMNLRRWQTCRA